MLPLAESLRMLDQEWESLGLPAERWLAPGLPPAAVRGLLADTVTEPPVELVDWFSWHNGAKLGLNPMMVPSEYTPFSLERAVVRRTSLRVEAVDRAGSTRSPDEIWAPTWFPLAWNSSSSTLVFDLGDPLVGGGSVYTLYSDTPRTYEVPAASSLAEVAELWVDRLRRDVCSWNEADQVWEDNAELDAPDRDSQFLVSF